MTGYCGHFECLFDSQHNYWKERWCLSFFFFQNKCTFQLKSSTFFHYYVYLEWIKLNSFQIFLRSQIWKYLFLGFFTRFSRVSKKMMYKDHFQSTRKKIFFINFIKILKNVTKPMFDKRFCCFYITFFFGAIFIFLPFKLAFFRFFTLFCKPSFWGSAKISEPQNFEIEQSKRFFAESNILWKNLLHTSYKFQQNQHSTKLISLN